MANQAALSPEEEEERTREAELEGGRMPFLSHLTELRDRVRNAAIGFMVAFLICWGFADEIFAWLRRPLFKIWEQHTGPGIPAAQDWGRPRLIYTSLTQPFWVNMSVALWAGIFVASPFIFYQLWRFIAPGLYKRERKITISFAVFSAVFFVSGALFCFYFALPALYKYMLHYNSSELESLPNIQDYLDLTRDSMLAFGAIFEMPLLIYFLAMVGLVTHRSLWKFSRWFIVLAFVIGAVLTPGPDVVSQFLMALPMIALYNISILFAWRVTMRRERAEAEQRAREAAPAKHKDDDDRNGDISDDDDRDDHAQNPG
ncbi:MAG TPA: twin-arginine translocase subunit TatC [Kofleriaceae bacterium]|nr:twin-arginine translocase subunit TatC [Kofleriaceae bacterium]